MKGCKEMSNLTDDFWDNNRKNGVKILVQFKNNKRTAIDNQTNSQKALNQRKHEKRRALKDEKV